MRAHGNGCFCCLLLPAKLTERTVGNEYILHSVMVFKKDIQLYRSDECSG